MLIITVIFVNTKMTQKNNVKNVLANIRVKY